MKKLILFALLLLFIGCPSAPKNSARIYIERGEYASAKEQILIGLKEDQNDYELHCLLAKAEIGLTNWLAASEAFQKGIAVDSIKAMSWLLKDKNNISVYWQAFYNAAVAHMEEKRYDDALKNLAFCKALNPKDVNVYIIEGGIYSEQGKPELASKTYQKALNIDPENPEAYFLIAKAFYNKEMYDSSLVRFKEAIKYFDKKYKSVSKIIFQNLPEVDRTLSQKIVALWFEKKTKELDDLLKVKLGFDVPSAQKRNVEKFAKTTEGLAKTYYLTGMTYNHLRNDTLALKYLRGSIALVPDDPDALFYTGETLVRLGKYQEAIKYFSTLTAKNDDEYSWFYTAVCHSQLKDFNKAIEIYENEVLRINPKSIDAMTNLAYCYREIGNNKKALEYLMKADELQKEN